jgi:hypothetical protein
MRKRRDYLGSGFEVWSSQWTWFWRLLHADRGGGVIGAAATEAEAIREACVSIEEIAARRGTDAAGVRATMTEVPAPIFNRRVSIPLAAIDWSSSLAKLGRYLTTVRGARA